MNAGQLERFLPKLIALDSEQGECWQWIANTTPDGYGLFYMSREERNQTAHRVSYEHFLGPIPAALTLDHLCRNRACVNPDHLEPVTNRENVLRGIGPSATCARRTHCDRGHEFTPENTSNARGSRGCRTCSRERAQRERDTNGAHVRARRNVWRRAKRAARTPEEKAHDDAFENARRSGKRKGNS